MNAEELKRSARDAAVNGQPMQAPSELTESQVSRWERAFLEQMLELCPEGG